MTLGAMATTFDITKDDFPSNLDVKVRVDILQETRLFYISFPWKQNQI